MVEDEFTELFELLKCHQRASRAGRPYYCWRCARKYNWLKRHGKEHVYHSALNQARRELDTEEEVARLKSYAA